MAKYAFSDLSEEDHRRYLVKMVVAAEKAGNRPVLKNENREVDVSLTVDGIEVDVMRFLDALTENVLETYIQNVRQEKDDLIETLGMMIDRLR